MLSTVCFEVDKQSKALQLREEINENQKIPGLLHGQGNLEKSMCRQRPGLLA